MIARSLAWAVVATTAFAFAAGCDVSTTPSTVTAKRSPNAKTLGIFSTRLASDMREQAKTALEQDAYRREMRFKEATQPGMLFASTRVEQPELEAGLWRSEEMFQLGAQLFHVTFTKAEGFGGVGLPQLARFHKGRRGGPDAYKCSTCHWRGGIGGAGDGADNAYLDGDGDRQSSALERNPPALHGAGLVELLAAEMTREVQAQRDDLVSRAKRGRTSLTGELTSKGVSFGMLDVNANGTIDTSRLTSIDADLVVRPFGRKGSFATLRDAVEESLNVHHGMQSEWLARHGTPDRIGDGGGDDPDGDGVTREITEGQVSVLTLFAAMQETPQTIMPLGLGTFIGDADFASKWAEGRVLFERVGCTNCHRPSLKLDSTVFKLPSRTGGKEISVDLAKEAAEPRITPRADGSGHWVELYSDLKRHDMGPTLAEARPDRGVPGSYFVTPPLWGLARSKPYLHDGRTPVIEEAVLMHGGEALAARNAYLVLSEAEKSAVRSFLGSLGRARRIVAQ